MDKRLLYRLDTTRKRIQTERFLKLVGMLWFIAAIVGIALWSQKGRLFDSVGNAYIITSCLAAVIVVPAYWLAMSAFRNNRLLAQRIENRFPELNQRLLAAVNQKPDNQGQLGYLQTLVVNETIIHDRQHGWSNVVSSSQMGSGWCMFLLGLCSLGAFCSFATRGTADPFVSDSSTAEAAEDIITELEVVPGNDEIERGSSVIITARFPDKALPTRVNLIATTRDGVRNKIEMARSLDNPLFGVHLPEVDSDFEYQIEFESGKSDTYTITVFEFPSLVQADARLTFPDYTNMEKRIVEDTRKITVVEGTETEWALELNKSVTSARFVNESGDEIELVQDTGSATRYTIAKRMQKSERWKLHLTDAEGRTNKSPPTLSVKVLKNRRPDLKLVNARDLEVSPIEELNVKATFWDDYGVERLGVSYAIATEAPRDIVLANGLKGKSQHKIDHLLELEEMKAEPDQLLAYNFWAEDYGPNGKIRRTAGDMYFAEVRHFEEIFRQGEQPPGGSQQQRQQQQQGQQGQNAQQAEQLAQLQKQIMNATWRLARQDDDNLGEQFRKDVALIIESQLSAREQLQELSQRIRDSESIDFVTETLQNMMQAVDELDRAKEENSTSPLVEAFTLERLSYQGLLKLRAREHRVVQSQQQRQSGSQSASRQNNSRRFQQQLQQLRLQNNQNRYETERQDQQEQQDQQRESRQILNRLKELAQRQEDLNKQLRELQAALQKAETEEEKEELNRRLKRLRDQQQEMLRDMDELQSRMDEANNQQQMQSAREQVEQSRENMQNAAQSLQQGQTSQALAAGSRAERELKQVRDQIRRENANQFSEQMRNMREQAAELDETQQELTKKLGSRDEPGNGLRDKADPPPNVAQELADQQEKLSALLDEMQSTIDEAESSEPLLAQKLYDAFRDVHKNRVEDSLRNARQLSERGLQDQAKTLSDSASEDISSLREDIDDAAESVLGDPTEGLRRAALELEEISRQLQGEISRADPRNSENHQSQGRDNSDPTSERQNEGDGPTTGPSENDSESQDRNQQQNGQQQNSQQQNSQQQNGQQQNGQQQNSQQQNGQQQNGQQQNGQQQNSQQQNSQQQNGQQQNGQQQNGQQQNGQQQNGQQQNGQQQNGQQQNGQRRNGQDNRRPRSLRGGRNDRGSIQTGGREEQAAPPGPPASPLTGEEFRAWSDRLRDVEEMIDDARLAAEAAKIRDRARGFRQDYKRHSKEPKWDLVREMVAKPLQELQQRVNNELLRRAAEKNAVVPIDRDPVPDEFTDGVNRYYERLGSGQ